MKIAILGAGNVGSTLGKVWGSLGHEIHYGVRRPEDPKIQELLRSTAASAQAGLPAEAAAACPVVLLATPWHATEEVIRSTGGLAGKTVIDATNPLLPDLSGLELGHSISGAERIAQWAPGASICKAFNTTGANIMANPMIRGIRTVMFVCGDDPHAKQTTLDLATSIGFDAVDVGPLRLARLLEPWALLWIHLAYQAGFGREFGFALLKR
jgi:predicted dinucleotide-binding enzyme